MAQCVEELHKYALANADFDAYIQELMTSGQMGPTGIDMKSAQVLKPEPIFRAAQQQQQLGPTPLQYRGSSGLGQGMQPRYVAPVPLQSMRRFPPEPISLLTLPELESVSHLANPVIRSNMYMMQQQPQHMLSRTLYARQPGAMDGLEAIQLNCFDCRRLLLSQQQQQHTANFCSMRPGFHCNRFNMAGGSMQQLTAMHQQQQYIRAQQAGMRSGQAGIGHVMGGGQGRPIAQKTPMNQAMLQKKQQCLMQQPQPH